MNLNDRALQIVRDYYIEHLDRSDGQPDPFNVYIVWQCHILGNRKWLISTTANDGMYYEATYNQRTREYYLDAYKKFENRCIRDGE